MSEHASNGRTALVAVILLAAVVPPLTLGAQVPYERLVQAHAEPQNWLTYSGSYSSKRFSALDQINTSNVGDLSVEWVYQTSPGLVETTPIVVDGVMYLTEPPSTVPALDPVASGRVRRASFPGIQHPAQHELTSSCAASPVAENPESDVLDQDLRQVTGARAGEPVDLRAATRAVGDDRPVLRHLS